MKLGTTGVISYRDGEHTHWLLAFLLSSLIDLNQLDLILIFYIYKYCLTDDYRILILFEPWCSHCGENRQMSSELPSPSFPDRELERNFRELTDLAKSHSQQPVVCMSCHSLISPRL